MTPFPKGKGKIQQVYVPGRAGFVQRSTGTPSMALAKKMERMVEVLRADRAFDLLEAVIARTLTLGVLYDHYTGRTLDQLRAQLSARKLADYLPGWLTVQQKTAPAAWRDQERQVTKLLGAMGPHLPALTTVEQLTPGAVRERLAALTTSDGTRRHYLYALSGFCTHLKAHGALAANPCDDHDLVPRPAKAQKRTVWKDEATDRAICDREGHPDIRIVFVLCAAAGADRATPLDMKVKDVHLLPEGTAPDQRAGREHRVDLPGSKTDYRGRKGVRLEPWAAPVLRAWIAGKHPEAWLIDQAVKPDRVTRHWQVACAAARVKGYWLRDTRHSYGVRAILAGYPLWEVSKWLGHGSTAITADVYLQFDYAVVRAIREGTTTGTTTAPADAGILPITGTR